MTMESQIVEVPVKAITLEGDLRVPQNARGIVLFAHGSGSSRHSPRNQFVAEALQQRGLATLLIDLLTMEEERIDERTGELRFDIELLADRLIGATDWLAQNAVTASLPIGCFGASTGAAAALVTAAERPDKVAAIVSRGGRPDLAGDSLSKVRAPTLLIVGAADQTVLELNQEAMEELRAKKELVIVPRATHLFEEPGALEHVAELAADWFARHLSPVETTHFKITPQ